MTAGLLKFGGKKVFCLKKKKRGRGTGKKGCDLFWLHMRREKPDRNRMFVTGISC